MRVIVWALDWLAVAVAGSAMLLMTLALGLRWLMGRAEGRDRPKRPRGGQK